MKVWGVNRRVNTRGRVEDEKVEEEERGVMGR